MESPGIETFYFINSLIPLNEITNLLSRYKKAPVRGRLKLDKRIQDKINALDPDVHDDLSSIASRLDKPVAGGVAFRGEDDDRIKDLTTANSSNIGRIIKTAIPI